MGQWLARRTGLNLDSEEGETQVLLPHTSKPIPENNSGN